MFESKINRGKANGYAPLDSAGKVPLDKTYVGANGTSGTSGISGTSGVNGSQGISGTSFTWGGAWDATNYYNFINVVVEYSGSSYICIDTDDNFGRNPSEESTYWNLMAASGSSNLTNIDLSTFATTGSNTFAGTQTISGSGDTSLTIGELNFIGGPSFGLRVSGSDGAPLFLTSDVTSLIGAITNPTSISDDASFFANQLISFPISDGPTAGILVQKSGSFQSNWVFDYDGKSYFPSDINIGYNSLGSGLTSGSLNVNNGNINVNGSATINGGYLILTGSSAPTDLTGSISDTKGMIVFDDNYLYYCTSDFEPETYTIVVMPGTVYNTHVSIPKSQGIPALSSNGWSITTQDNTTYILTGVYSDNDNWDCEIDNLNSSYNGGIQIMTLTNLNYTPVNIWKKTSLNDTTFATTGSNSFNGNQTITGSIIVTGSVYADNLVGLVSSSAQITQFGGLVKNTGSWTVTTGTADYSFTLEANNTYQIWVLGNVPNGIISYNGMVTISNTNVPVIGSHNAWNYTAGNELLFTSIPNQIVTTSGSISAVVPGGIGTNTNTFTFGITNNAEESVVVNYGYIKLS